MSDTILQSEATAALRETTVLLLNGAGAGVTGVLLTGGTPATLKIAKSGGNFGVSAGATLTEITGGVDVGLYALQFHATDVNTVGDLRYEITLPGTIITCRGSVSIANPLRTADFAADFLTSGLIATDAIDAAALKADAAVEIGVATWATLLASASVAGSVGDLLQQAAGALNSNSMIDNVVYGAQNVMTSARRRVFASAAALASAVPGHANNADGEIQRYTITSVDIGGGQFSSYKESRNLPL